MRANAGRHWVARDLKRAPAAPRRGGKWHLSTRPDLSRFEIPLRLSMCLAKIRTRFGLLSMWPSNCSEASFFDLVAKFQRTGHHGLGREKSANVVRPNRPTKRC